MKRDLLLKDSMKCFLWVVVNDCRSRRCVLLWFFNPPCDEQIFPQPGSWHQNCGTSLALGSSVCGVDDGFCLAFAYTGRICVGFVSSKIWKRSANFALISSSFILPVFGIAQVVIVLILWLSVPLGFLLISRMLILKHLNYTSAMSLLLYFQDGKSPVRGSWNLLKYSDNGGQNSRGWLSACLWFCLLCSDCWNTSTSHVVLRLCNSSLSASQYTLCVEI